MKAKDTESSDWPEGEPSAEQKVTLEDYQQLIIQMRKANVQFQQMCNIPSGELTMLLTLRHLLLAKAFVIPSDIGDAMKFIIRGILLTVVLAVFLSQLFAITVPPAAMAAVSI